MEFFSAPEFGVDHMHARDVKSNGAFSRNVTERSSMSNVFDLDHYDTDVTYFDYDHYIYLLRSEPITLYQPLPGFHSSPLPPPSFTLNWITVVLFLLHVIPSLK